MLVLVFKFKFQKCWILFWILCTDKHIMSPNVNSLHINVLLLIMFGKAELNTILVHTYQHANIDFWGNTCLDSQFAQTQRHVRTHTEYQERRMTRWLNKHSQQLMEAWVKESKWVKEWKHNRQRRGREVWRCGCQKQIVVVACWSAAGKIRSEIKSRWVGERKGGNNSDKDVKWWNKKRR